MTADRPEHAFTVGKPAAPYDHEGWDWEVVCSCGKLHGFTIDQGLIAMLRAHLES